MGIGLLLGLVITILSWFSSIRYSGNAVSEILIRGFILCILGLGLLNIFKGIKDCSEGLFLHSQHVKMVKGSGLHFLREYFYSYSRLHGK